MEEKRYLVVIFLLMSGQCDRCGKTATALCSGCKKIYYCSATCQREAWMNGHKAACELLSPPSEDEKKAFLAWLEDQSLFTVTDVTYSPSVITPDLYADLERLGKLSQQSEKGLQLYQLLSYVVPSRSSPFGIVRMDCALFALVFSFYTLGKIRTDYIRFMFPLGDQIKTPASGDLYNCDMRFATTTYMLKYEETKENPRVSFAGQWIVAQRIQFPSSRYWGLTHRGLRVSSSPKVWLDAQIALHKRLAKHPNCTAKIICELDPDLIKLLEKDATKFQSIVDQLQKFIEANAGKEIKGKFL